MQKHAEQLEIFTGNAYRAERRAGSGGGFLTTIFTFEKKIILFFSFLIVGLVAFSIGIERGKRITRRALSRQSMDTLKQGAPVTPQATQPATQPATAPAVPPATIAIKRTVAKPPVKIAVPKKTIAPVKATTAAAPAKKSKTVLAKEAKKSTAAVKAEKTVYTVQIASFKDSKAAHAEAEALTKKGVSATVLVKGDFSIVCVGNYSTKETAQAQQAVLLKKYPTCYVRRM